MRVFKKIASLALSLAVLTSTFIVNPPTKAYADVQTGLTAWYEFDDQVGSATAIDSTGNGYNATLNGTAAFKATTAGDKVLALDGASGSNLQFPNGISNGLADYTIATWVNFADFSAWSRVFEFHSADAWAFMNIVSTSSTESTLHYTIYSVNEGIDYQLTSSTAISVNEWKHVAVTQSGTTAVMYIDGVEAARNTDMQLTLGDIGEADANYIGNSSWSDPVPNAMFDDFRIYSRSLTQEEISTLAEIQTVDKAALAKKIADAQALTEPNYTEASWAVLQTALVAAIAVNNKADATQDEVNTTLAGLEAAIAALKAKETEKGSYVMAYSKTLGTTGSNNSYMSFYDDSLHLAYSDDGVNWTPLNDNKGILFYKHTTSYSNAGAKQFRDPFIFRKEDGTYVLLATTVRYNGTISDVTINYWDSTDLLNWNNQKLITVSSGTVYAQKPQCKYDAANDNYVIIWSDVSNNVFFNTIDKTFTTVSVSAPYTGTDYPAAVPSGVDISNPPSKAIVGSVIAVPDTLVDSLVAQLGTPKIPVSADAITVTTEAGKAPVLPDEGTVNYSDGTTVQKAVYWNDIDSTSYTQVGTFEVTGIVEGVPDYINPINKNGADPDIFKGPDGYYYYTSSYMDYSNNGVANAQYDRIAIRKAATIQALATAEERTVFLRKTSGIGSYHIWAPEIHYVKFPSEAEGKWVIYFAASRADSIWALRVNAIECDSQDPMTGNWSDIIEVGIANQNFDLDATVFEHNGEWYMIWAHKPGGDSQLWIAKMTSRTTVDTSTQVLISSPQYTWERRRDRVLEGATIMKKNGKIFLGYAAGSTDSTYCIGLLTAEDSPNINLLDAASWKKTPYPLMIASQENQQFGPGHATFTVAEDGVTPILSYHARPNQGYSGVSSYSPLYDATRYARVAVIYWHEDGTPYFGIPPKDGYLPGAAVTATVTVTPSTAVDKSALQAKINEAQALTEANYTAETWAALQTALTATAAIMDKTDATLDEVNTALANLEAAIAGLIVKGPTTALTAASSVQPGSTFNVGISLGNLDQGVYAEDITLSYDSNVFEYVDTAGENGNIQIVRKDSDVPGTLRIAAANIGGVTGASTSVLKVTFKVKSGVQNTSGNIAVTKAKLGVAPQGTVIQAGLSSRTITVSTSPSVDKTALTAAISSAQSLHDSAVVGTLPGQYPQTAKDAFNTAINAAKSVYSSSSATQSEVDSAVTALNNAVDTFKAAVVKEVSADLNKDGSIDVGDLAIVAYYYGKDSTSTDWETAKAADMNNDNKIDISDLAYVATRVAD